MSLNSYSLHDLLNIFNTFIFIKPFIKHNCNIRLLSKAFRLSAAIVQIIDKNTVQLCSYIRSISYSSAFL